MFTPPPPVRGGTHSTTTPLLLSLIIPGGGQWFNGQTGKSALVFLLFFGMPVFCLVGTFVFALIAPPISLFLGLSLIAMWFILPILWFAQVVDSAMVAGRINRGEPVGPWDWF